MVFLLNALKTRVKADRYLIFFTSIFHSGSEHSPHRGPINISLAFWSSLSRHFSPAMAAPGARPVPNLDRL